MIHPILPACPPFPVLLLGAAMAFAPPRDAAAAAAGFSTGSGVAAKFGVHEVVLTGSAGTGNPFDTTVAVRFVPPSGEANARTVAAFYDGDNTWRARTYVSEPGRWRWSSSCATDARLDENAGAFEAAGSRRRGRLLVHPENPWQWMTEDGRWFLNLNDTAYFLLCPYQAFGRPVRDEDARNYVRDIVTRGITSIRSFTLVGPQGMLEDSPQFAERWRDSVFADDGLTRLRLPHFRVADERLRWLLETYPELYVQFILFSRGARWKHDDQMWRTFTPDQKERVMRHMIARYAAYPQILWLVTNDAHYGPEYPRNNAMAREVGEYFRRHDPWRHPMAAGHARGVPYYFGDEAWSTYLHLEENFDAGALQCEAHHRYRKPVFLGEDRYEQDHPGVRDPVDMRYFQRRLFWSWLLAGGSANYGGRWWDLVPYGETGSRASVKGVVAAGESAGAGQPRVFTEQLTGLDSVRVIRDYFSARQIELSDFEPAAHLVRDRQGDTGARAPKLMRRGTREFLIYHPNATSDDRHMTANRERQVEMALDLAGMEGEFAVEWFRAVDGAVRPGAVITGGRVQTLAAPWPGQDCVVRLTRR